MTPLIKSLALRLPAFRKHMQRVDSLMDQVHVLSTERDLLQQQVEILSGKQDQPVKPKSSEQEALEVDWHELKRRKQELSAQASASAATSFMSGRTVPVKDHLGMSITEWITHQVVSEPYWFQKIEVIPGLYSPGWSDPQSEKLPYYGLPEDLTGKRVLDIGCAEGFFSFEAEKRGAREVIGIDSFPDSIRRFNIAKAARQSNATAFLMNVYDLEPKRLGTFDIVLFYGVFYHLKHPQLALDQIRSVCTGELRFQTYIHEEPAIEGTPWARFYPHGKASGKQNEMYDPTVFWLFNSACCLAMLDHVGFTNLKVLSTYPLPFVVSAMSPTTAPGAPPDQSQAPWS